MGAEDAGSATGSTAVLMELLLVERMTGGPELCDDRHRATLAR